MASRAESAAHMVALAHDLTDDQADARMRVMQAALDATAQETVQLGGRDMTFEQVRIARELWVLGGVLDGITHTRELARAILRDEYTSRGGAKAFDLFTCEPLHDEERMMAAIEQRVEAVPPPNRLPGWNEVVAATLGATLLRLIGDGRLAHSGWDS